MSAPTQPAAGMAQPSFPDTEPRFDIGAALRTLGTSAVDIMVLPLSLGPGSYVPPRFSYATMEIVG